MQSQITNNSTNSNNIGRVILAIALAVFSFGILIPSAIAIFKKKEHVLSIISMNTICFIAPIFGSIIVTSMVAAGEFTAFSAEDAYASMFGFSLFPMIVAWILSLVWTLMSDKDGKLFTFMSMVLMALSLGIYVPVAIASMRGHKNLNAIFALNLFWFGGLTYVLALAWSVIHKDNM